MVAGLFLLLAVTIFTRGYRLVCFTSPVVAESIILRKTPLGSSENEVILYLTSREGLDFEKLPAGFNKRDGGSQLVGEKSIEATIGNCLAFGFKRLVVASWAFDKNDRLVGVWVRSYVDAF